MIGSEGTRSLHFACGLGWAGRVSRMDRNRKLNETFKNKHKESRLTGRPKSR